ncbi:hypothetical protein KIN20_015983 [Parelaphostrongylus tenuis]|uniref:Uncharacterized protein n=1 Tax=Parelaphostrongylus tenuis TaxID=148309 RepID=A0AAD5MFS7_PARTN|nr:hypothetical protein KIN20_015983 [Parelaphostrongylus tenuis]
MEKKLIAAYHYIIKCSGRSLPQQKDRFLIVVFLQKRIKVGLKSALLPSNSSYIDRRDVNDAPAVTVLQFRWIN